MEAQLVTLGNDLVNYYQPSELMGNDIVDFFKATGKAMIAPFTATAKGFGHFVGEAGRGISRGDWGRLALSPLKGVGHTAGSLYRADKELLSYYWRPSRMGWMKPVGALITATGAIPSPLSPFLLAGGAALTTAGTIGTGIHQKDLEEKAAKEFAISQAEARKQLEAEGKIKKQTVWMLLAGGGAALAATYFL